MSVSAVYVNENATYIYNDRGDQIYNYCRRHDGSSASGNAVLIDASESGGYMELLVFDDKGKLVREVGLNPRPRR